ncbi:MAG TPA: GNAT family N-acetyltransferase [Solirubrobacteraceae bacterium]|nr:GNAT family N-acetyltransferase [Solirubrobacteraceae bacterium]
MSDGAPRIVWVTGQEQYRAALALREQVFCGEQGVPPDEEMDGLDEQARHVVAIDDGRVVGTLRLLVRGEVAKIGRVAVEPRWRRRGIGQAMMDLGVQGAREAGCARAILASQTYATELYEKAGFIVDSDVFYEAGLPHVWMVLAL